jgi:hypothetical protein
MYLSGGHEERVLDALGLVLVLEEVEVHRFQRRLGGAEDGAGHAISVFDEGSESGEVGALQLRLEPDSIVGGLPGQGGGELDPDAAHVLGGLSDDVGRVGGHGW